jgi:hypothetical protein
MFYKLELWYGFYVKALWMKIKHQGKKRSYNIDIWSIQKRDKKIEWMKNGFSDGKTDE